MNDLEWLLQLLHINPASSIILIVSTFVAVYLFIHVIKKAILEMVEPRFFPIERKLGIIQNGKPLEQVVTRGDLEIALDSRFKEFSVRITEELRELVIKDVCELKHLNIAEDLRKIEEMMRERRLKAR